MNTRQIWATVVAVVAVVAVVCVTGFYYGWFAPLQLEGAAGPVASWTPRGDGTDGYYSQKLVWGSCDGVTLNEGEGENTDDPTVYQCARVSAPLDWDAPSGESIELAVAVRRSGTANAPFLFVNPGGPGGAVVESLPYYAGSLLGKKVVRAYDIVALDPRGVGQSTPVRCLSDSERDEKNAGGDGSSDTADLAPDEIVAAAEQESADFAAGCERLTGELYKHVDTVSAAKDFDLVRALVGAPALNLLGYSYGTFLGATYAGLFPDKVGRFVLDGAVDPAVDVNEMSAMQMRGLDAAIQHWIDDCQAGPRCPLGKSHADGVSTLVSFIKALESQPMRTRDPQRPLTSNLALSAIYGAMYDTSWYQTLTSAVGQAISNADGSALLEIADLLNERNDDGTYSGNSLDALVVVNNLDYGPVGTVDEWAEAASALEAELPIMGPYGGYPSAGLAAWPTAHAERAPITAAGAAPIVVVGTTHDPATPYPMAQSLASQLSSGVLVSVEGWDHTSYKRGGNQCAVDAVEKYLVDGTVPQSGLMCQ